MGSASGNGPRYMGGQAVMEGVMMRGERTWAVAVRTPEDLFFREDLDRAAAHGVALTVVHSRRAPEGQPVGRLTRERLAAAVFPPEAGALVYVCGSTPFVEQVLRWLAELGHDTRDVRAERFGGS